MTGNGSFGCLLVTAFFVAAGAFLAADLLHLWPALYQAAQSPAAWPVVIVVFGAGIAFSMRMSRA